MALQPGLNSSLTGLSVGDNNISHIGCARLAESLEKRKRLRSLSLRDNKTLGDDGAEALSLVLEANDKLAVLDLCNTGLTFKGFKELVEVLSEPGRVCALNVSRNRLASR